MYLYIIFISVTAKVSPISSLPTMTSKEDGDDEISSRQKQGGRRRAVAAESYDPTSDTEPRNVVLHPKTEGEVSYLQEATKDILFFKQCDSEQLNILYNAMFRKPVASGDVIIRQGDDGDNFYIIQHGDYDILINDDEFDGDKKNDDARQKYVKTLKNSGYFGELALLYNCPRSATIRAATNGLLWGLDQKTFREIVVKESAAKRERFEQLLSSVAILKSLTEQEVAQITDALHEVKYSLNECIVKEGDSAQHMFFIVNGSVSVKVRDRTNTENEAESETEVVQLSRGQYFGELALIMNKGRVASVYSLTEGLRCAVLDIYAFERLLGPCVDIMKRNISNYEEQRKMLGLEGISNDF